MVDSKENPQQYKFSNHEFKVAHPTEKGGYAFKLRVFNSRAVNDIKKSTVAKDLLKILQQSRKATELTEQSVYEFVMDKGFLLNINREDALKISEMDETTVKQSPYKPEPISTEIFGGILETYSEKILES
jgi:hypothetical protein